jgi:hypothetical protein
MATKKSRPSPRRRVRRRSPTATTPGADLIGLVHDLEEHHEATPRLTGGDIDADWARAEADGEETVGGSVTTPDQDIVDEIARALGVEQDADAEIRTTDEILRERDRLFWQLEGEAADAADGRVPPRGR